MRCRSPYAQTEGYVPVTSKAQQAPEYQDYLARAGEDDDTYYDVKIQATQLLLDHTEDTFVTPVFNGSASLRDAAGQLIENTVKSVRRHETIDESYWDKLFSDVSALYHLDERSATATAPSDLGPLPTTAVVLLASLAAAWVVILIWWGGTGEKPGGPLISEKIPVIMKTAESLSQTSQKRRFTMKRTMLLALGLTVALVAAGCGGGNTSEENTSGQSSTSTSQNENTLTPGPVMSYEEYMAAELDSQVTIETYVQAKQSWWEDKATLYTQDQDGAYFIYNVACSQEDYDKLTPGTKIQVTGYKTEWSGEVEIMDGVFQIVEGGDTYVAEPLDVTELLSSEDLINHQNQLVSFTGLTVEASEDASGAESAFLYNWDGSGTDGDDLYFNVSYNGETYTFTVESYLCDNTTDVYAAVKNLQIGQTIDAEGFLYWYEGVNPHITSITVR